MSVDLSLGELQALTAKAFRGAGYPWGLAVEGAHAARVLAQRGLPAADIVARLVSDVDGYGPDTLSFDDRSEPTAPLCPVASGAALADIGGLAPSEFANLVGSRPVIEPLLLAPFVANCTITWPEGTATITTTTIEVNGSAPQGPTRIELGTADATALSHQPYEHLTRALVAPETLAVLERFASRTYAPATEESRRGAGEDTASL